MDDVLLHRALQYELALCHRHCYKWILIQPSLSKCTEWQVILMPSEGVFKGCTLIFGIYFNQFPKATPLISFQSGVLHPCINYSNSANFDVNEVFPAWAIGSRVYDLINAVFASFIEIPIPQKPANPDAVKLLKQGSDAFAQRARELLPAPELPSEDSRFNQPKGWTPRKEKLLHEMREQPKV
jgi:ubiquitin-protein ligase